MAKQKERSVTDRRSGEASSTGAREIPRRDFLNGMLVGASGLAFGGLLEGCADPLLPPAKDGGDVNAICHAVRDGKRWDLPAPSGSLLDCIIIGGGISGLVAAWRLGKKGAQNILVLEKDTPEGGMSRKDGDPAHPFSQAAAYTTFPYNDNLIALYEDLGVVTGKDDHGAPIVDGRYLLKGPVNNVNEGGKWYEDAWEAGLSALPYPPRVIADLKAFREQMRAYGDYVGADGKSGFDTPSSASTTDAAVRDLDNLTLLELVTREGWDPAVSRFWDPYCRSALGTTHDRVSAWAAISFLCAEFRPTLSQPGGNAYLAEAISAKVGAARRRTGVFVLRAQIAGSEVHVSSLEGGAVTTRRARTLIYAAPRFFARYLLPDLAASGRSEASSFQYTPYLVANVQVSETPDGLGYDNWVQGESSFTDFIVADWAGLADPARAPRRRPNVLTVYAPLIGPGRRGELLTQPLAAYERLILADLERALPGVRGAVTAFDLYRWGHAMLAPERGFIFGAARVGAQAPLGPISFAHHDVDGLPAFENAVASGLRAADEVAKTLGL